MPPSFALGVVILAAGRSTRMGRPKLLLPWGDTSVIGHLISEWRALEVGQVAVVRAADDAVLQLELDRLGFSLADRILNPTPERGMFSSVQCAARWSAWKAGLTHWAIVLGDQPQISRDTLRTILAFSAAHPEQICVPKQGGHRRHPLLLPRTEFLQLAGSTAPDLKSVMDHHIEKIGFCELDDAALELDIDRPEDYERAVAMFLRKR